MFVTIHYSEGDVNVTAHLNQAHAVQAALVVAEVMEASRGNRLSNASRSAVGRCLMDGEVVGLGLEEDDEWVVVRRAEVQR